jgi:hypothetical protein
MRTEKRDRAVELRDIALAVVKARGKWESVRRGPNMYVSRCGPLTIAYRGPFQKLPSPEGEVVAQSLRQSPPMGKALTQWGDMSKKEIMRCSVRRWQGLRPLRGTENAYDPELLICE